MADSDASILEQFLEMMLIERGSARHTLAAYRADLLEHGDFLRAHGKDIITAESQDLQHWQQNLTMTGLKASSLARKTSAVKQLYQFAFAEQLRSDNPAKHLQLPRCPPALPKILTEAQISRLFEAIAGLGRSHPKEAIRLTCLLEILYGSGLRVSELVSLPVSAIVNETGVIHLQGKGAKERIVPLSRRALEAIAVYLPYRSDFLPKNRRGRDDQTYLFPSKSREGHLTRQRFGQMLKTLAGRAEIPPAQISPHVIRHAFAGHLLNNGAPLLSVQKMLGHADITTTQIYTHILDDRLKDFVIEHHPLNDIVPPEMPGGN